MAAIKLASSSDLEDLALELGGSVRFNDGRVFNSSARSGAARIPRLAPAPVAPPQPAAPVADNSELMAKIVELLARPAPIAPPPVAPVPPQVVMQAPPPVRAWSFAFERNSDGTIKTITATAK